MENQPIFYALPPGTFIPNSELEQLNLTRTGPFIVHKHDTTKECCIKAVTTGNFRAPRAGEWFLNADKKVEYATYEHITPRMICRLVKVKQITVDILLEEFEKPAKIENTEKHREQLAHLAYEHMGDDERREFIVLRLKDEYEDDPAFFDQEAKSFAKDGKLPEPEYQEEFSDEDD
jgi:hypothetical protein